MYTNANAKASATTVITNYNNNYTVRESAAPERVSRVRSAGTMVLLSLVISESLVIINMNIISALLSPCFQYLSPCLLWHL